MIEDLCSNLPGTFCEIDQLAAILLRFCRDHAQHLRFAYDRHELCELMYDESDAIQVWFEDELDEDWLDSGDLAGVANHMRRVAQRAFGAGFPEQSAVVAARAVAEALDRSHGRRFAGVFRGRQVTEVTAGEPIPILHPPLKDLFAKKLGTNPLRLGPQLHELTWLRLMPDVARGHRVRLDFRHGDLLANLAPDDRLAVIIPGEGVSSLGFARRTGGSMPRFFGVRPKRPAEQSATIVRLLGDAAAGGARIVILPELCLDDEGLDAVKAWHAQTEHRIALLVCGSVHTERDGQRRNVSTTILPSGSAIEHYKFNPFYLSLPGANSEKPIDHREDIVTTPSVITLYMCADWSFTTLICKDFLEPGVAQILEEAFVRLVLVPACSPKTGVFVQIAGILAARAQAVIVVGNLTDLSSLEPASVIIARPLQHNTVEQVPRSELSPPCLLFFDLAPP